jgi:hypothetical protein
MARALLRLCSLPPRDGRMIYEEDSVDGGGGIDRHHDRVERVLK